MRDFKQNNRFDNRGNSRGGFGGRDSGRPSMHKVVCSDCGKDCEVPFKPTGDKPVFCTDCFRNKNNAGSRRSDRRDFGNNDRQMHKAVCNKCGKDCEVPFKPTGDKPIYCNDCFGNKGDKGKASTESNSKKLEAINDKLDQILKALGVDASVKSDLSKQAAGKVASTKSPKATKDNDKKVVSSKKVPVKKKVAVKPKVKSTVKSKAKPKAKKKK